MATEYHEVKTFLSHFNHDLTSQDMGDNQESGTQIDSVTFSSTPIFQPISHPVMSTLGQAHTRRFIKTIDAYSRAVKERRMQEGGLSLTLCH
jgi:hypothetical protein